MGNVDSQHKAWILLCKGNRIPVFINDGLEAFRVTDDDASHAELLFLMRDRNTFAGRDAFDHMASCNEVLLPSMVNGKRGTLRVGSSNVGVCGGWRWP